MNVKEGKVSNGKVCETGVAAAVRCPRRDPPTGPLCADSSQCENPADSEILKDIVSARKELLALPRVPVTLDVVSVQQTWSASMNRENFARSDRGVLLGACFYPRTSCQDTPNARREA